MAATTIVGVATVVVVGVVVVGVVVVVRGGTGSSSNNNEEPGQYVAVLDHDFSGNLNLFTMQVMRFIALWLLSQVFLAAAPASSSSSSGPLRASTWGSL